MALTLRPAAEERPGEQGHLGYGRPQEGAGMGPPGRGSRSPSPRPARPALPHAAARGRHAALLQGRPSAHGGLRPGAARAAGSGQRPGSAAPRLAAGAAGAAHGSGSGVGRTGSR